MSKVTGVLACHAFAFFGVMSQKWSTTTDRDHHHSYVCLGIRHSFHPSVLFSLVNHTEQRMTHSGRGYLQLELISGAGSAAPTHTITMSILLILFLIFFLFLGFSAHSSSVLVLLIHMTNKELCVIGVYSNTL